MNIHPCARTCAAGRAMLVKRVLELGWSVEATAKAAGISTRTVYKWLRRFRLEGEEGLADRSSRPQRSPTRLQLEKGHIALELRLEADDGGEDRGDRKDANSPTLLFTQVANKDGVLIEHEQVLGKR